MTSETVLHLRGPVLVGADDVRDQDRKSVV